jgi:hypothetical protein
LPFSFKLDAITVKGLLSDFGGSIHFAKHNGRYVVVIEGDQFQFEKGMSPIELLQPRDLSEVLPLIGTRRPEPDSAENYGNDPTASADDDDAPPW